MSLYFDGVNMIRPQARARIDTSGMTPVVLGSASVVMIFGHSTGGAPKTVLTFSDPNLAAAALRSGDLLTAGKRAWNASAQVPGASVIQFVRIDPAVQSSIALKNVTPATCLTLTSLDYGAWTIKLNVKVEAGSGGSGIKITIQDTSQTPNQYEVYDNLATVAAAVLAINTLSHLVSAVLNLEGTIVTSAYAAMAGGTDGTSSNNDWQAGFNLGVTNPANHYVPLTSDPTVQPLTWATIPNGRIYVGQATGSLTKSAVAVLAMAMNQPNVIFCSPCMKQLQDSGAVAAEPSYFLAAQVAGMFAGNPIDEPMTYKYVNALGVEVQYSGQDLDDLDGSGVCAVEVVPNQGYRIAHSQSTWVTDLNVTKREWSVGRIGDFIKAGLLANLIKFVGKGGKVTSIGSIKTAASSYMDLVEGAGYITGGTDPVTGLLVAAYRNIQVTFNSLTGVCAVSLETSPVTPINYVPITVHFTAVNIIA
jgi:hypothetical protein